MSGRSVFGTGLLAAAMAVAGESGAGAGKAETSTPGQPRSPQDLQVVDCLLPGQLRKLGRQQTYLSRRRPVRTTALDCEIRGGEYVAFDRANYETALRVWLEAAEAGDPQAQYYVGEIHQRGLGTEPDYVKAAEWYRKAADQGNAQAQTSLGFLYEKGLGVSLDPRQALEWYRKAAGVSGVIMLDSEVAAIRNELSEANAQLEKAESDVKALDRELADARRELEAERSSGRRSAAGTADLKRRVADLELRVAADRRRAGELQSVRQRYDVAGPTIEIVDRSAVRAATPPASPAGRDVVGRVEAPAGLASFTVDENPLPVEEGGFFRFVPRSRRMTFVALDLQGKRGQLVHDLDGESEPVRSAGRSSVKFGPYHALIIGNSDYLHLPRVETVEKDVSALAELLRSRYGFRVTVLRDATYLDVLSAFSVLRKDLQEKDNLLVYYAGHGDLDRAGDVGYWLPVDAEKDRKTNWISSREISVQLSLLPSKHVLVIADSCYSGALTRSSLARFDGSADKERDRWIGELVARRSRTALTSGGLEPVLDSGGGGHSIFARAVLDALGQTTEALETYRLWSTVKARVMLETRSLRYEQVPEYAPIQYAGHESGEFFFVPSRG